MKRLITLLARVDALVDDLGSTVCDPLAARDELDAIRGELRDLTGPAPSMTGSSCEGLVPYTTHTHVEADGSVTHVARMGLSYLCDNGLYLRLIEEGASRAGRSSWRLPSSPITLRTKLTDLLAGINQPVRVTVYSTDGAYLSGDGAEGDASDALKACDNPAAAKVTVDVYDDDETMCLVDTYHLEAGSRVVERGVEAVRRLAAHAAELKSSLDGECADCGDPAPIGLYMCAPCHARAREMEQDGGDA